MLARDVQSNQMPLMCRSGPDTLPNAHYQDNAMPHLNTNVCVGYSTQPGHDISLVSRNDSQINVFRKPFDNKTLGPSMMKFPGNIYNSQVSAAYCSMGIPLGVQSSSDFPPSQAPGPWPQQMSFHGNSFMTQSSFHTPVKPSSVSRQSRVVLNESQSNMKESLPTYGNYCHGNDPGSNSLYNSRKLASHEISYPCTNKQHAYPAAWPSLETPSFCPEVKETAYLNAISTPQEEASYDVNETGHDSPTSPYENGQDIEDPQHETFEEIQKISDIIWKEMKGDTPGGGIQGKCTGTRTFKCGPLISKRFSIFRRLVNQFYQDSRHRSRKDEECTEHDGTSVRNSHHTNEISSGTKESRWFSEEKPEYSKNLAPYDSANKNGKTESCKNEDSTEKNIILSLVCPDLKIKDPLVYLKFPFYSVEGEQLRPFLKRCVKPNNQTTGSNQTIQNNSQTPDTLNLIDQEPSCEANLLNSFITDPMEYSDSTTAFNKSNGSAFISEFNVDDLKQTISCIEKSYVEHVGTLSTKMSTERKQWILDVFKDLRRLREKIFGPKSSVKAELQHEIFYATGINVDFTRNVVSEYTSRIYKHLPGDVKFFCSVPGFGELSFDDKRTLISECLLEYWFLGWFNNADEKSNVLIDSDHQILLSVDILKESFPNEHSLIKEEMELAVKLSQMELTPQEIIMLKVATLLCPTRAGLKDLVLLDSISRKCRECLRFLLYQNHEESETILSQIDAFFLQFRRLSGRYRNNRCREFILDITQDANFLSQISA